MAIIETDTEVHTPFEQDVAATQRYFDSPRFDGIIRLYTARQVVEQRGTIPTDYTVAREAAAAFYARLRELFAAKKSITTFGPYSPGQAVSMKRMGIEGIYLGGWATSAKGSITEDPGPDLASYPLSQVPDEAAVLVRALLTADRNQQYLRLQMSEQQRATATAYDYRPFIIADADTGHGGDPHVRNLIRRFVEVGVPGLPHRGPAPRHQEVRPPGRQGAGAVGRTDQAPQHRPLPARHHAGARHHRRAHRRRGGQPDRQPRRRARPAVPARRHQPEDSVLQGLFPGADAALLRAGRQGAQRSPALRASRRRVRHRRRVA